MKDNGAGAIIRPTERMGRGHRRVDGHLPATGKPSSSPNASSRTTEA